MKKFKMKRSGDIVLFLVGLLIVYFSLPYAIHEFMVIYYDIPYLESTERLFGIFSMNAFYLLYSSFPLAPFTYPYLSTIIGLFLIIFFTPFRITRREEGLEEESVEKQS